MKDVKGYTYEEALKEEKELEGKMETVGLQHQERKKYDFNA